VAWWAVGLAAGDLICRERCALFYETLPSTEERHWLDDTETFAQEADGKEGLSSAFWCNPFASDSFKG